MLSYLAKEAETFASLMVYRYRHMHVFFATHMCSIHLHLYMFLCVWISGRHVCVQVCVCISLPSSVAKYDKVYCPLSGKPEVLLFTAYATWDKSQTSSASASFHRIESTAISVGKEEH